MTTSKYRRKRECAQERERQKRLILSHEEQMLGKEPEIAKSETPPKVAPETTAKRPWRQIVLATIGAAATLIGVVAALLTLLPRVTATIADPVDPKNPFSSSVTITNTGYLPLNSITCFVRIEELRYGNLAHPIILKSADDDYGVSIKNTEQDPVHLGLDDRFTFEIHDALSVAPPLLSRANIAIAIRYKTPSSH